MSNTDSKNLKDTDTTPGNLIKDIAISMSFNKTTKLVTALYMVTDIMDKEEPMRNKLRNLGMEIISDIHNSPSRASEKIIEIVSILTIASTMNFVSEMNSGILKKEFIKLNQDIRQSIPTQNKPTWLEDFLNTPEVAEEESFSAGSLQTKRINKLFTESYIGHDKSQGQGTHMHIGVQKGGTLMQALSNKTSLLSNAGYVSDSRNNFILLKKERQNKIISIIKDSGGNATIKDIKVKINTGRQNTLQYSEKTIQRELISMVKEGVLYKTGEKRWSRYFIKQALGS